MSPDEEPRKAPIDYDHEPEAKVTEGGVHTQRVFPTCRV